MSEQEIEKKINEYIKRTSRLLPDGFETEDLLEDLKSHIHESLAEKRTAKPSVDPLVLLGDVLEEIGSPEDIAEEYRSDPIDKEEEPRDSDRLIRYVMRLVAAIVVAVLAAWVVSTATELVDFATAVIVLVAFAFIEWAVRGKQTEHA